MSSVLKGIIDACLKLETTPTLRAHGQVTQLRVLPQSKHFHTGFSRWQMSRGSMQPRNLTAHLHVLSDSSI